MTRTGKPKTGDGGNLVSLKVTLRGIRPPVWRRLIMPGTMTLGDLHEAMGWEDGHLHAFDIGGTPYGDRRVVDDEHRLTPDGVVKSKVPRFRYTYDFGDNWEHTITVEKSPPAIEGRAYPACVAGKRNCPPEDCGGVWGYAELLHILADPAHPERADRLDWLGEAFDPEDFSVAVADAGLVARFGRG